MSDSFSSSSPGPDASARGYFQRIGASDAWNFILRAQEHSPTSIAVFDVRSRKDFDARHVEGARHLTESTFPEVLREVAKSTAVVIYCYHGNASQSFAAMFADFGFPEVYSVDGGYEALLAEHDRRKNSLPEPEERYLVGDVVFAKQNIFNDGGVPDLPAEALLAEPGARGVVVRSGHVEADPQQVLYVVRFESADGRLGPPVGCLPDELTQVSPRQGADSPETGE
ncbi:MAG TPA: rhodanese-like domain-containing protein [Polyangiaceae bacterium]|nr:rhodanese-like domain-containing protein [Polyangiaceae bacterium]